MMLARILIYVILALTLVVNLLSSSFPGGSVLLIFNIIVFTTIFFFRRTIFKSFCLNPKRFLNNFLFVLICLTFMAWAYYSQAENSGPSYLLTVGLIVFSAAISMRLSR